MVDTKARITLAAHFRLEGMTPAAMAAQLYPRQKLKDHARHSTVVFLGRHADAIERDQARVAGLSERELDREAAVQKLNSAR